MATVTMARQGRRWLGAVGCVALLGAAACDDSNPAGPSATGIDDDAAYFRLISQTDPFTSYTVFPRADEFATGQLNGSEAHRSIVRVLLNRTAANALQNGLLPPGGTFPDGSIIFKEIRPNQSAQPSVYAVMLKDARHGRAGDGWLWAEFGPAGNVVYSMRDRGGACTGCHTREQGRQRDLVRTFERQR
jgi:hypothetical protein